MYGSKSSWLRVSRFVFCGPAALATGVIAMCVMATACGSSTTKAPEVPKATLSDFSLAFEVKDGTREVERSFTIYNHGKASLDIDSVKLAGDDAFVVRVNPILPSSIAPNDKATFNVTFRPPGTRSFAATATVLTNDPRFPALKIDLKGVVIARTVCRSDNPCQRSELDEKTGRCVFKERTGSCDDGMECTNNDRCLDGVCIGIPTSACEAAGACIPGTCDAAPIPSSLLDETGNLKRNWKRVLE